MTFLKILMARLDAINKRLGQSCGVNFAELKQFYKSIKEAPAYPIDFKRLKVNAKSTRKMNNKSLLEGLRKKEGGDWIKVYLDGYSNGKHVSIHYFQSKSGWVFDVKVKPNWSNNNDSEEKECV